MAAAPVVMMWMMAASAAVAAYSAIQQGKAADAAGEYNRVISDQNAAIARSDALAQAEQVKRENYMRLGSIRAAQGKSGGVAGEGSVLDVLGDTAAQGELERQNVIYQGEQRARGFVNTGQLEQFKGDTARETSYYKAGSELLGGAANSYSSYNSMKVKRA